jgi:hypothetical protein
MAAHATWILAVVASTIAAFGTPPPAEGLGDVTWGHALTAVSHRLLRPPPSSLPILRSFHGCVSPSTPLGP